MKNRVKLFSILFLVGGVVLFSSCNPEEKKPVDTPTKLSVTDVTEFSAKLTWVGTADSYEIMVGDKSYSQSETLLLLTGLTEGTTYAWKVRAKKGSDYSEWVDGSDFTTKSISSGEISVYFGNEHWTAPANRSYYQEINSAGTNLIYVCGYSPLATEEKLFPMVMFYSYPSSSTTYAEDEGYRFEYAEQGYLTDGTNYFGDWMAKSGTVTITSNSGGKVSGIADVVMFNARQKLIDKNPNPETRTLTLVFKNVNLLTGSIATNGFVGTTTFENANPSIKGRLDVVIK